MKIDETTGSISTTGLGARLACHSSHTTARTQARFSKGHPDDLVDPDAWSGGGDLNSRPPRPERGALPNCATTRGRDIVQNGYREVEAGPSAARSRSGSGRGACAFEEVPHQASHLEHLDWLREPRIRAGTPGDELVGHAVQQQQHRAWGESARTFFEA